MTRTISRLATGPLISVILVGAALPSAATADVSASEVIGQDGSTTQKTLAGIQIRGITHIDGKKLAVGVQNANFDPSFFAITVDGRPVSTSQSTVAQVYDLPVNPAGAGIPSLVGVAELQAVGERRLGIKARGPEEAALWAEEYSFNEFGGIDSIQRVIDFSTFLGGGSPCNFGLANLAPSTFVLADKEYLTIECSDDNGAVTYLRGLAQDSLEITGYIPLYRGGDDVTGPSGTGTSTVVQNRGWSVSGEFFATANLRLTATFDGVFRNHPGYVLFDAMAGTAGPIIQPDTTPVEKDGYTRVSHTSGDGSDGAQIRYNNSSAWMVPNFGTAAYPSIVRNRGDSAIEDPMLYALSAQSTPSPMGLGVANPSWEFLIDDPNNLTGTGDPVMTNNGYTAFRPPGPHDAAILDSFVTDEYGFSGATQTEWRAAPTGADSNARSIVRFGQPLNEYTDIGLGSPISRYARGSVVAITAQAFSYLPNGDEDQFLDNYLAIYEYAEGPYLFAAGDVNGDDLPDLGKIKWAETSRRFHADLSYGSTGSFLNRVVYENDSVVDYANVGISLPLMQAADQKPEGAVASSPEAETPQADGTGTHAAVALLGWTEAWQPRVQIRMASDGSFVNNVQFFDEGWNLIEMQVIHDFSGGPVIAVLAVNRTTGEIAAQLRRPTGAFVRNVFFLNANWNPLQLIVLPNLGGGAEPELGVLATNDTGQIAAMVKDAGTNGFIKNVFFLNANWTPLKAVPLAAEGTDGPRVALLAANNNSGQLVVMVKEAASNTFLENLFPFGSAWMPEDIVAVEDQNGNGYSEIAVLAINESSGKPVIQLRDSDNGSFVRNINPLGSNWRVTQMVNAGDADGDTGDDLSVIGVRKSDRLEVIQTLRASDGSLVSNAF
jgi:hypothetical protein